MPTEILMPALSPTMEEGKLARWLVKEGDQVSSGDIIAEIETDKATMEVEAVDEGTIASINVAEGTEGVKVNTVIAVLAGEGEDGVAAAERGKESSAAARSLAARRTMLKTTAAATSLAVARPSLRRPRPARVLPSSHRFRPLHRRCLLRRQPGPIRKFPKAPRWSR